MEASNEIKELIKRFEGVALIAYRCPAGVPTIGYGHTGSDVRMGMAITEYHANTLLERDVAKIADELTTWLKVENTTLKQQQFDALVSFAFNLGISRLRSSTLWKKMCRNANDRSIGAEFERWVYATVNGKRTKLKGLVERRKAERRVWEYGL